MALGTFSGGGLGMGVAFTLYDQFSNTATEIERSMGRLTGQTSAMTQSVNASMNQMAVGAGLLGAGIAALAPIGMGLKIAGEFEQARVGLETFLHTRAEADRVFNNIKADAKTSATFDTQGLLVVNRALISAGIQADAARKDTNNLANAVAAVGGGNPELERMAVNMQQIKNVGKASAMDIKQFAFAGINIYQLLANSTGKTTEQVKDLTVTYDMLSAALAKSAAAGGLYAGASEKQAKTINGMLSNLEDNWKFALAGIGEAVQTQFGVVILWASEMLGKFAEFVNSPFGSWLVKTVAITAVLAIGLGAVLLVSGFLRFSIYKLAGAFTDTTKSMILQTIAQRGVAAGFRQIAVAAWSAMAPFLLYIGAAIAIGAAIYKLNQMINSNVVHVRLMAFTILAFLGPIGWVVGAILGMVRGLKDFDGYMNGTTRRLGGLLGTFQKIGGVIRGVAEMLSNWDSKTNTFTWSEKLDKALDGMGIKQLVLSIGTYVARIMAFWQGLKAGFSEGLNAVKGFILGVINAFTPAEGKFKSWDQLLGKATGAMTDFAQYGRIAGYILVGVLTLLTIWFASMAISVIAATWPILAIIAALGLLYLGIGYVIDHFAAWKSAMGDFFSGVWNDVKMFMVGLLLLPAQMFSWGVDFVQNIWNGVKSKWTDFKNWLADAINNSFVGKALEFVGIGKFGTEDTGPAGNGAPSPVAAGGPTTAAPNRAAAGLNNMAKTKANNMVNNRPTFINQTTQQNHSVTIPIMLDSEVISNKTIDISNRGNERSND